MAKSNFAAKFTFFLLKLLFEVKESASLFLNNPRKILVIRQHNQFGDLLASVSLFRAVKETFPETELSVIVSPDNHYAIDKNKFIDKVFLFDKSRFLSPEYLQQLWNFLKREYDIVITPATVSISTTSCLLSRLANAKIRIGPESLDGKKNPVHFLFNKKVKLDWRKHPDSHVSDFCLDIVRPFGIKTSNFSSEITFDETDSDYAQAFILEYLNAGEKKVFGFHVGAGKSPNRWPLDRFAEVITYLKEKYDTAIYLTGSKSDKFELDYLQNKLGFKVELFINQSIPRLAAMISASQLFITNDTGVMHVAGTTDTPQISLFGPTNPFNWAPIGNNKYFLRKSEFINDISTEEVISLCEKLLNEQIGKNES